MAMDRFISTVTTQQHGLMLRTVWNKHFIFWKCW